MFKSTRRKLLQLIGLSAAAAPVAAALKEQPLPPHEHLGGIKPFPHLDWRIIEFVGQLEFDGVHYGVETISPFSGDVHRGDARVTHTRLVEARYAEIAAKVVHNAIRHSMRKLKADIWWMADPDRYESDDAYRVAATLSTHDLNQLNQCLADIEAHKQTVALRVGD